MQPVNGRRSIPITPRTKKEYYPPRTGETSTGETSEIVNYICDTWNEVNKIYKQSKPSFVNGPNATLYQPEQMDGSNGLPSFERFDLEAFWGKKVFQNCRGGNRSP